MHGYKGEWTDCEVSASGISGGGEQVGSTGVLLERVRCHPSRPQRIAPGLFEDRRRVLIEEQSPLSVFVQHCTFSSRAVTTKSLTVAGECGSSCGNPRRRRKSETCAGW